MKSKIYAFIFIAMIISSFCYGMKVKKIFKFKVCPQKGSPKYDVSSSARKKSRYLEEQYKEEALKISKENQSLKTKITISVPISDNILKIIMNEYLNINDTGEFWNNLETGKYSKLLIDLALGFDVLKIKNSNKEDDGPDQPFNKLCSLILKKITNQEYNQHVQKNDKILKGLQEELIRLITDADKKDNIFQYEKNVMNDIVEYIKTNGLDEIILFYNLPIKNISENFLKYLCHQARAKKAPNSIKQYVNDVKNILDNALKMQPSKQEDEPLIQIFDDDKQIVRYQKNKEINIKQFIKNLPYKGENDNRIAVFKKIVAYLYLIYPYHNIADALKNEILINSLYDTMISSSTPIDLFESIQSGELQGIMTIIKNALYQGSLRDFFLEQLLKKYKTVNDIKATGLVPDSIISQFEDFLKKSNLDTMLALKKKNGIETIEGMNDIFYYNILIASQGENASFFQKLYYRYYLPYKNWIKAGLGIGTIVSSYYIWNKLKVGRNQS